MNLTTAERKALKFITESICPRLASLVELHGVPFDYAGGGSASYLVNRRVVTVERDNGEVFVYGRWMTNEESRSVMNLPESMAAEQRRFNSEAKAGLYSPDTGRM